MGWFQRVLGVFGRRRIDPIQLQRFIIPVPESGVRLTADEALQLAAVWACIDAIAKAIASCDWNIYQPKGKKRHEQVVDDPLNWILNTRPNPEMTAIAFREALLYIGIPFGNAYAEIIRDGAGRVAELWPLEVDRVTPRRNEAGQLVYHYRQPDGALAILDARQVFHLRGPSLSGFLGENLVARAARSLSIAAAQERFAASFFGRGAHPGGVLEHPGKLSPERVALLEDDFDKKRAGPHNAYRPMILEDGMKWTTISVNPQESQLLEERQFAVEEICRWFGVPPHKVQHLLRSTFSNIEHQSIEFVRDALAPWCVRLQQEADFKLFRQDRGPWRYTKIDTAPLSYGDAKARADAHAVWRQNGIMSANEIRRREGLDDIGPDGDVLLVQANLTTVENIVNPPKPPPAAVPAPAEPDPNDKPAGDDVSTARETLDP
jgi:HK97 family phage portal protein